MGFAFARYRRPFTLDGIPCEVLIRAEMDGLHSELRVAGVLGWLSYAVVSALVGIALGAAIAFVLHKVLRLGAH